MNVRFGMLPKVQDLISECNENLLVREIMEFYPRKNARVQRVIQRAIREMKQLDCGDECCLRWVCSDGCMDSVNPIDDCVIVVPRQRFTAINADVYVRRVHAEYLDGSQARVLASAVCGKAWQEVLRYSVWGVDSISVLDMHSLMADVCFCMLKCGSSAQGAQMSASLCKDLPQETFVNVFKRVCPSFDANVRSSLREDERADFNRCGAKILCVAGMCALEQLSISLGWLEVLNKRADEIFIAEASRLQKYAS